MKRAAIAALAMTALVVIALPGCNKVTKENYDEIESGMTVEQVKDILGEPTDSSMAGAEIDGMGVSGGTMTWKSDGKTIVVTFANGKVANTAWVEGEQQDQNAE